jgi:hypothetical protein
MLVSMTPTPTTSIDLTGLPEKAADAVRALVDDLRRQHASQLALPYEEWKKLFDELLRDAALRSAAYPEGFVVDDSRESIYEGRGE